MLTALVCTTPKIYARKAHMLGLSYKQTPDYPKPMMQNNKVPIISTERTTRLLSMLSHLSLVSCFFYFVWGEINYKFIALAKHDSVVTHRVVMLAYHVLEMDRRIRVGPLYALYRTLVASFALTYFVLASQKSRSE